MDFLNPFLLLWQNNDWSHSFQLAEIRRVKLSSILCDNSDDIENIQVLILIIMIMLDMEKARSHMGSSAQDGENEQYLALFFWSFTVAKRFDFLKFRQLFWRDFDRYSLKILLFWSWEFFWIFKNFVFLPQNQVFSAIFDALVRPNRQSWTGFDLLIILGVKFWWFSFFLEPL